MAGDRVQEDLVRLWPEQLPARPGGRLQAVRFPADLRPHPTAAAESYRIRAILVRENAEMFSVQAQLDRLALGVESRGSSEWNFSEIMRAGVVIAASGQQGSVAHEVIERRALDLANSTRFRMHVIDTQLDVHTQIPQSAANSGVDVCRAEFSFSTVLPVPAAGQVIAENADQPSRLQLKAEMQACPEALSLRRLNSWQSAALPAQASLDSAGAVAVSDKTNDWQGHAWFSQGWGDFPRAGGAVWIDQANLHLFSESGKNDLDISITRSKRKSGRGPQTVQAMISTVSQDQREVDFQWIDEGEQLSAITGIIYPRHFRLRSRDAKLDLLLTPLVDLPEIRNYPGPRWEGAVRVSGSHSGIGFVDYWSVRGVMQEDTSG